VHRFDYLSVAPPSSAFWIGCTRACELLAEEADAVHLVGHSLGGLLALRACLKMASCRRAASSVLVRR
jgi:alpha-beta hydrolase superfamily lysophospholipase